jgi:hypothetical protein
LCLILIAARSAVGEQGRHGLTRNTVGEQGRHGLTRTILCVGGCEDAGVGSKILKGI